MWEIGGGLGAFLRKIVANVWLWKRTLSRCAEEVMEDKITPAETSNSLHWEDLSRHLDWSAQDLYAWNNGCYKNVM